MINKSLASIAILEAVFVALVVGIQSARGGIIYALDFVFCTTEESCIHETAHMMDGHRGNISQSVGYSFAVQTYRIAGQNCESCRDDYFDLVNDFPGIGSPLEDRSSILTTSFWNGGWGGYRELYAAMYERARGNIHELPEVFQPFYQGGLQ